MKPEMQLQEFINAHISRVEPLAREAHLAYWELQTTSSLEAKNRSTELSTQLAKIYANPEEFAFLKSLPADSLDDARLARQHELLVNRYLENQLDERVIEEIIALEIEIEDEFNTFRAQVRDRQVSDNEIEATLIESNDSELRRETWEASKAVGAHVAQKLLHLVRLRNSAATRLGFENYYVMSLILQELDEPRLFSLLDNLKTESDPLWQTYKAELDAKLAERFHTTPDAIRPWHQSNRFFQEPGPGEADLDRFFTDKDLEALTAQFFTAIGLPVEDLLQRADLYERPGKCQHAFCMDVDQKGDVRVLCNCRSNERWMGTMLHEFGHAVYDKFCDPDLPYLLRRPAHTMTTESIALFMGRLTKDARWLRIYAGVAPDEAQRIAAAAGRELRDHLLVFTRWCLVMANFERALYRDPEQDLDALWWSLVETYQGLVCPPENRLPGAWASKVHLATSPVYYHNYLLGEMMASQLLQTIESKVLADEGEDALVTSPKLGEYMKTVLFYPGALRAWDGWIEAATGEPLNPKHYVAQLQISG